MNVTITVLDGDGQPVPTATIRFVYELDRHRVNSVTGTWDGRAVYLPDGTELRFTPGMTLAFEASAPGYATRRVSYDLRRRRNRVTVVLEPTRPIEFKAPDIVFNPEVPQGDEEEHDGP